MAEEANIIQEFGVRIFIPRNGKVLDIFALQEALENAMVLHARITKQKVYEVEVTAVLTEEQAARRAVIDELIVSVPGPIKDVARAINALNNTIKRISKKYDKLQKGGG